MDPYVFCLCLGFGGLLLMAVLGLGHHSHHGQSHVGAHHAHAATPHLHHAHHASHHAAARPAGSRADGTSAPPAWLALLSPRVLFGAALGFGATGTFLRPWTTPLGWLATPALAVLGAWLFERGIVQPLWRFLFGFASKPARTLDSAVLEEGRAACNFDAAGQGLVALQLDGQVVQLLGTLCAEDRAHGARVRAGDRVFIREVDARRNTCTVARLA